MRMARSLTQRGLAVRLRRPHSMVSRWESDLIEPSPWDLYRLGRTTGTSVGGLLESCTLTAPTRRHSSRAYPLSRRVALGRVLVGRRSRRGFDLEEAVARTGILGGRILQIEAGADPSLREIVRLSEVFEFSIDEAIRNAILDNCPRPPRVAHQLLNPPSWTVVRTAG